MKKTIGLISANYTNRSFGALTAERSFASLPFGGRYRLVDFPLSNMINSGINTVGLITPYDFRSLVDHVGDGKAWSLDRKVGGMFILPGAVYGMRTENTKFLLRDVIQNRRYLEVDNADYVLVCGSSRIFNMDFRPLIEQHERNAYPITLAYCTVAEGADNEGMFLSVDDDGMVKEIMYGSEGESKLFMDCFVIDRQFLLSFIDWFKLLEYMDIMEIIMDNLNEVGVDAFEFTGYVGSVENVDDYMRVSMDLLNGPVRRELFQSDRRIYTKEQDVPPTVYRPGSAVKNSIIAAGCIIEGTVENSIIFRSSRVGKGAAVKNSVLMQNSVMGSDSFAENVIFDKYVVLSENTRMEGGAEHPLIIGKNQTL